MADIIYCRFKLLLLSNERANERTRNRNIVRSSIVPISKLICVIFLKFWNTFFRPTKTRGTSYVKIDVTSIFKKIICHLQIDVARKHFWYRVPNTSFNYASIAPNFNGITAAYPSTRLRHSTTKKRGRPRRASKIFWTLSSSQGGIQLVRVSPSSIIVDSDRSRKEGISRRLTNRRSESKRIIALRNARNLRISAKRYPR